MFRKSGPQGQRSRAILGFNQNQKEGSLCVRECHYVVIENRLCIWSDSKKNTHTENNTITTIAFFLHNISEEGW